MVVTMHQKPDGDAMGSSLALYHFLIGLGHTVTVVSPTNWANFLNWMPGVDKVVDFEKYPVKATEIVNNADYIFCLDFNILHRTKKMETILQNCKAQKVLIDHHELPATEQFAYGISNVNKSSTAEMVYDFIIDSQHNELINIDVAECIYTGVMTDTGSFRFPVTSSSVHRLVAHLKDLGLKHTKVHDFIYDSFLENRLRFIGHALLNRMEVLYEYNTAIMSIPKFDLSRYEIKTGDTEGLVNYLLTIEGIKFGAIVIDRDEERKWSFRSKGNFDVNTFAREHFNGGGHFNAAGGGTKDPISVTVQKFKQVLEQYQSQLQ